MIDCVTLAFIEELVNQISSVSASPGFTWGRSGVSSAGAFGLNDSVPCNVAGRQVPITSGKVTTFFVAKEDPTDVTFRIFKHPSPFTTVATIVMVVADGRAKAFSLSPQPDVTGDDELGVEVTAGSAKNWIAGCIIRGTI
jgi:hypothetical protein